MNQVNTILDSKALIFKAGQDVYGIYINQIVSIERIQTITPYPNRPEHVLGVTSIRDMVIPMIHFSSALTGNPKSISDSMRIILVNVKDKVVGIVVDSASDVIEIDRQKINHNAFMGSEERAYLLGVLEHGADLVILLDIEKLLENVTNLNELREMVESFKEEKV